MTIKHSRKYSGKIYLVLSFLAVTFISFSVTGLVMAATEFGGNNSASGMRCDSSGVKDCNFSIALSDSSYQAYSTSISTTIDQWIDTDDATLTIDVCLVKANGVNYACSTFAGGKIWPSSGCSAHNWLMSNDAGTDGCTSFGGTVAVDSNSPSPATWATFHIRADSIYTHSDFSISGRRDFTPPPPPPPEPGQANFYSCGSPQIGGNYCAQPGDSTCDPYTVLGPTSDCSAPGQKCCVVPPTPYPTPTVYPTPPPTPVNGSCSSLHYGCSVGTSVSNVDGASTWTWTCHGSSGGTNASCLEHKPTVTPPSGTLSVSPPTCTIASGASICNVSVSWSTANLIPGANTAVTRNNPDVTVSTATSGTVNNAVNYGQSTFYLYHNGAELAPSMSVNASCVAGTVFNGSICQQTVQPVNGGWSGWTPPSCPTACGQSASTLTRTCTNPAPANGGTQCTVDGSSATQSCPATAACVCTNGASNYPTCGCTNGATNYPTCTITTSSPATVHVVSDTADAYIFNHFSMPKSAGWNGSHDFTDGTTDQQGGWYRVEQYPGGRALYSNSGEINLPPGGNGTITIKFTSVYPTPPVYPTPHGPVTGTLTPSALSCIIPIGGSSCNINFSWSTVFN